ncbi:DUF6929 family protein [Pontibacter silvestris]|uniref:DUF6929 family protein n=2 Tax=Pontibacter silvestris TaxID=2305183 RepID=A0ABW4WX13_9BACT
MSRGNAFIEKKIFFENLPSASGLESTFPDSYYVLGDDSPFLYRLDSSYTLAEQYPLFSTENFTGGRIPKALKPDLECMAQFKYRGENYLFMLGSGSTEARYKGFAVNLDRQYEVTELELNTLYAFLKQVTSRNKNEQLNLEGLAMDNKHVYLLQRSLSSVGNVLFRFETDSFISYLMESQALPAASVFYFSLPQLDQYTSGFSGAYVFHNYLFFTASVEGTTNVVDDGEMLGSYLGYIELEDFDLATSPDKPLNATAFPLKYKDGTSYKGKAESLVIDYVDKQWNYKAVVVSDDDLGHSELLEVLVKVK